MVRQGSKTIDTDVFATPLQAQHLQDDGACMMRHGTCDCFIYRSHQLEQPSFGRDLHAHHDLQGDDESRQPWTQQHFMHCHCQTVTKCAL